MNGLIKVPESLLMKRLFDCYILNLLIEYFHQVKKIIKHLLQKKNDLKVQMKIIFQLIFPMIYSIANAFKFFKFKFVKCSFSFFIQILL